MQNWGSEQNEKDKDTCDTLVFFWCESSEWKWSIHCKYEINNELAHVLWVVMRYGAVWKEHFNHNDETEYKGCGGLKENVPQSEWH